MTKYFPALGLSTLEKHNKSQCFVINTTGKSTAVSQMAPLQHSCLMWVQKVGIGTYDPISRRVLSSTREMWLIGSTGSSIYFLTFCCTKETHGNSWNWPWSALREFRSGLKIGWKCNKLYFSATSFTSIVWPPKDYESYTQKQYSHVLR